MKFKSLNRIIFIISISVFIINLVTTLQNIKLVSFIPLVFGVLSLLLIPKRFLAGPGLTIALMVMIIRYILVPYLLANSFFSYFFNEFEVITFNIMILEMFVILFMINRLCKKNIDVNKPDINKFSYIIPLVFIVIAISWSLIDPMPLSRFNFILSGADELVKHDLTEAERGLPTLLIYTQYLLIISLFYFFYKLYTKTNRKIFFLIGFISVFLVGSFYRDTSRNSLLLPLLTILFLNIKAYPKYKNKIILTMSLALVLSMGFLSMLKFFKTSSYEKGTINTEVAAVLFNSYFGGYYEVYLALEHSDDIKFRMNDKTIYNEIFGNTLYFNKYVNHQNKTADFYNETAYSTSHIIPTIGQGYIYMGFFLSWIFTFIVFRIIFLLDDLYFRSKRVDFSFVYALASISLGWIHPGSLPLATSIINVFIVMFIIVSASSFLGKIFYIKKNS